MEEIIINKIEWKSPEYNHQEHGPDWFWAIGLITLVIFGILIWIKSYLFAIFIVIAGASLSLFNIRHPREIAYSIETSGLTMGNDKYGWKDVKGFDIKKGEDESKLLIEINKYFLPVYTIPISDELIPEIKESLLKVVPQIELEESRSVLFMEKLGF